MNTFLLLSEQRLAEMSAGVAEIQDEIRGLQGERARLLAQLERVELALTKAQARKVRSLPSVPCAISPSLDLESQSRARMQKL